MTGSRVLSVLARWAGHLGLTLFGTILALVLLEGGLRVASSLLGPRPVSIDGRQREVVLALGDSNTYGVYYTADQAYPGQLQSILQERAPDRFQVVNLGLPGMNSSEVVTRLPEWLSTYRPYAVIVCVGVNNLWNRTGTLEAGEERPWRDRLRVVRLFEILRANLQARRFSRPPLDRALVAEGREGEVYRNADTGELLIRHHGDINERRTAAALYLLSRDLQEIRTATAASGARLILLTYAAFPRPDDPQRYWETASMNQRMRELSRQHGVTLVDTRARFLELLEESPRAMYFATESESHPNPRGYAEIARLVADSLVP